MFFCFRERLSTSLSSLLSFSELGACLAEQYYGSNMATADCQDQKLKKMISCELVLLSVWFHYLVSSYILTTILNECSKIVEVTYALIYQGLSKIRLAIGIGNQTVFLVQFGINLHE